jgi:hypothetical protein
MQCSVLSAHSAEPVIAHSTLSISFGARSSPQFVSSSSAGSKQLFQLFRCAHPTPAPHEPAPPKISSSSPKRHEGFRIHNSAPSLEYSLHDIPICSVFGSLDHPPNSISPRPHWTSYQSRQRPPCPDAGDPSTRSVTTTVAKTCRHDHQSGPASEIGRLKKLIYTPAAKEHLHVVPDQTS